MKQFLHTTKWQVFFLAGVILLLYLKSLSFKFIGLDEESLLVQKKEFNEKISNIPQAFTQHVFYTDDYMEGPGSLKFYRPLQTVSFIIDEQFSRDTFSFFYFTNILFHIIAVIGLLFVLIQLNINHPIAFLLTLLFAVHPLLIQAIAWIPGRGDSMMTALILWSMYFLIRHSKEVSMKTFFFHSILFAAAVFTKESAVMFFPLCLFWIIFIGGRNLSLRNKINFAGMHLLIILFWFMMRKNAAGEIKTGLSPQVLYYSFLEHFPLVLQYFQKLFFPFNLSVMSAIEDTNCGWVALTLAVFGTGIYLTKKIPWMEITFGLLWYFLFLLPTLLFSYFEGMEHRSYLPVIGIIISCIHLDPISSLARKTNLMFGVLGIPILIFAFITFNRISIFSSEFNYWKNAYETSEHSAVVCRDYGVILTKMGDYQNAEKVYLEGIKRNPQETLIHYNLGVMYYRAGRFTEAKKHLIEELNINSTNFMVYHVLGVIYNKEGRTEEAITMWEQAISLNSNFTEAYKELLSAYSHKKDTLNFERCKNDLEKRGLKIVKRVQQ